VCATLNVAFPEMFRLILNCEKYEEAQLSTLIHLSTLAMPVLSKEGYEIDSYECLF